VQSLQIASSADIASEIGARENLPRPLNGIDNDQEVIWLRIVQEDRGYSGGIGVLPLVDY
jgi:hypothetical protein